MQQLESSLYDVARMTGIADEHGSGLTEHFEYQNLPESFRESLEDHRLLLRHLRAMADALKDEYEAAWPARDLRA
jgi:hypothetical protein